MRCGNLDVYSEKPVYDDTGVLLMTGQSKQPRKSTIVLISGPGLALDRSLVFRPLRCVPLGCQHKLHHLWPLFQLGPQRYSGISGTLKLGHPSAYSRGRVNSSCMRSSMLHASEIWAPTSSDLHRLQCNEHAMIWWMSGLTNTEQISSQQRSERLHLGDLEKVLCTHQLRWHGHVICSEGWL